MRLFIADRTVLRSYRLPLASIPLCNLDVLDSSGDDRNFGDACVFDLDENDHLVLLGCSQALLASHRGVRCNVSFWLREPPAIQQRFYRSARLFAPRFDSILTFDAKTLSKISNAVFVPHGGCWITDPSDAGVSPKTESISIVASPKRSTPGQQMRHQIIDRAAAEKQPLRAFGKQYEPLHEKRNAHEKFRFSVVIENSKTSNYFTEKLIDSFVCCCLPIYWGAPEIADYFDPRGMLICETFEQALSYLRTADEELYESRRPYLEQNRNRALRYTDPHRLLLDAIRSSTTVAPQTPSLRVGKGRQPSGLPFKGPMTEAVA